MSSRSEVVLRLATLCVAVALTGCGSDPAGPPPCVDGSAFHGEHFTIQAITTGSPPRSVDVAAARGALTVVLHVGTEMIPPGGAHVELWSAGRALGSAPVSRTDAPVAGASGLVQAGVTFDSVTLPNGPQMLDVRLVAGGASSATCPANAVIFRLSLALTISNP